MQSGRPDSRSLEDQLEKLNGAIEARARAKTRRRHERQSLADGEELATKQRRSSGGKGGSKGRGEGRGGGRGGRSHLSQPICERSIIHGETANADRSARARAFAVEALRDALRLGELASLSAALQSAREVKLAEMGSHAERVLVEEAQVLLIDLQVGTYI